MTNKPMLSVEREHRLKIHRKPFLDLESGGKTSEIRDCSDRDFQVGDSVILVMVDETGNPTPNELRRKITHVQTGYGLPDDLCVLSYEPAAQHQGEPVRWERMSEMKGGKWWPCSDRAEADAAVTCGWTVRPLYAEQPAPVAVVIPKRDSFDIEDLAGSFCQEALSFGINQDVFARYIRTTIDRTLAEVSRLNSAKP